MGGGDLNMKKHFHPLTMENLEKVWIAEQNYKNELRKIEQRKKEIEEEKNRKALLDQATESGLISKQSDRLEWMYSGNRVNPEEYLLGREIDAEFIEESKSKDSQKTENVDIYSASVENRKVIDMERKIKEDPLFLIKRKELSVTKDIMSNSERLKQIMSTSLRSKRSKDAMMREGATPAATPLDRKTWSTPSLSHSIKPTPTRSERKSEKDRDLVTPSRGSRSKDFDDRTPVSSSYKDTDIRTPSRSSKSTNSRKRHRRDGSATPPRSNKTTKKSDRNDKSDRDDDDDRSKLLKMMKNAEWRESTRKSNVEKINKEEELEKKILEKMQRLRHRNADTAKILQNAKLGKYSSRRYVN